MLCRGPPDACVSFDAAGVPDRRSATLRGAVGLFLDLAVIVLAGIVIGSLALLAWTLAVNAVEAVGQGRARVAQSRHAVSDAEARLHAAAERASTALAELTQRTAPRPGDRPDR